jgi:hypothetical protein
MMYNTQNYLVFGLCQPTGILKTREQNVSLFLRDSPSHLRMETDPVSETLCSLVFRVVGDGRSPNSDCTLCNLFQTNCCGNWMFHKEVKFPTQLGLLERAHPDHKQ